MMRKVEQINSVDDLLGRYMQVDDAEIILKSVTDESDTTGRLS